MQSYCIQSLTQSSKDKHRPWTVTAPPYRFMWLLQPSPDYLSPFYGSCFQAGQPGEDLTRSQIYVQGTEDIQEGSTETVCLRAIPSLKHLDATSMLRGARRSLTRQYLQSLIKCAFDRTLRDKGSQPLGREGTGGDNFQRAALLSLYHVLIFTCESRGESERKQKESTVISESLCIPKLPFTGKTGAFHCVQPAPYGGPR